MAYSRKDGLPRSPGLQLQVPVIPDWRRAPAPPSRPWWLPPSPATGGASPYGSPPPQPELKPFDPHLWVPSTKPDLRELPSLPHTFFPSPPTPENKSSPFPDPLPPPHDVDPSERNPYNDPDYSPFLITENRSSVADGAPQGGLLGRLLALYNHQSQGIAGNTGLDDPRLAYVAPAQEFPDNEQTPIRILARRVVR